MHYWGYDGWGWGMGLGMGFMMIVFWALVIVAIVYLVRYFARGGPINGQLRETPLDILKKRYAKGEITKEQYDRMKEDLKD
jgi:putative membrane protein